MNRKIKVITICVLLVVVALIAEVVIIKKSVKFEASVEVAILSQDVEKFQLITDDMVVYKNFRLNDVVSGAVKSKEDVINKYTKTRLFKDEQVISERISDKRICFDKRPDTGDKRYITLAFTPEKANGWILDRNQIVDLLYLPKNYKLSSDMEKTILSIFSDVRIVSILDEDLNDVSDASEREHIPRYILFEVATEDVENIVLAKNNGIVEILVK